MNFMSTKILNTNNIFKSEWRLYNSELLKFRVKNNARGARSTQHDVALSPFVELQKAKRKS